MVPPGEEYGDFEKFFRPFSTNVWLGLALVFAVATIVTILTIRSSETVYNFVIGRGINAPFLNLIAVIFGVSQKKLPKRNFARFILMMFILYCLIVRTVYQVGMYNNIKSNEKKPDLASIDEMLEKKYDFYLYETLATRASNFKFYARRKVFPNDDIDIYRKKTLDPKFKGVVFSYLDQLIYLNEQNYKNFSYHISKEIFLMSHFVFYFAKNHYLVDEVNERLNLMLTGGIIQHIRSQYTSSVFKNAWEEAKGPKQLKIKHFIGALRLLFMFNLLAFIVFLLEILTKLMTKLKTKLKKTSLKVKKVKKTQIKILK